MAEGQSLDISSRDEVYHPQDAIGNGIRSATFLGGAGLFISAVQNSIAKQNVGTFGVISRTGGSVALFGMCGIWREIDRRLYGYS